MSSWREADLPDDAGRPPPLNSDDSGESSDETQVTQIEIETDRAQTSGLVRRQGVEQVCLGCLGPRPPEIVHNHHHRDVINMTMFHDHHHRHIRNVSKVFHSYKTDTHEHHHHNTTLTIVHNHYYMDGQKVPAECQTRYGGSVSNAYLQNRPFRGSLKSSVGPIDVELGSMDATAPPTKVRRVDHES